MDPSEYRQEKVGKRARFYMLSDSVTSMMSAITVRNIDDHQVYEPSFITRHLMSACQGSRNHHR